MVTRDGPDGRRIRRDTGRPAIRSGTRHPALVIAPRVDDLLIEDSVAVRGGLVIGEPSVETRSEMAWFVRSAFAPGLRVQVVPRCWSPGGNLRKALDGSADDSSIVFYGLCRGPFRIDRPLSITGDRWFASGKNLDTSKVSRSESGPPRIRSIKHSPKPSIVVDPSVDHLMLDGFHLSDGFAIGTAER